MRILALIVFTLSLTALAFWYDHEHLLFGRNSGFLQHYRLVAGPIAIGTTPTQASGLTYDVERGRLFAVGNRPAVIHELTPDGRSLRAIRLLGFTDTEAIAHLGGDLFAVVSERPAILFWFRLPDEALAVQRSSTHQVHLPKQFGGNEGLEGLTYARPGQRLYLVKESSPREVLRLNWPLSDTVIPRPENSWRPGLSGWWGLQSLSGVHYDEASSHLFVVSRASRTVVEFTLEGEEVGRLYLKAGSAGLSEAIGEPEGIAITDTGILYICSEPDLLYVFAPPSPPAP